MAQATLTRINGEVEISGGNPTARFSVELVDPLRHQTVERTIVTTTGRFDFLTSPGEYDVRLVSPTGEILKTERIRTSDPNARVEFHAEIAPAPRPSNGVVSIARLSHTPPRKAIQEFEKASRLGVKGDSDGAIAHLKKAIAIDPDFMEAHHDLGCKYIRTGQTEMALVEFLKAIELDPGSAQAHANLAILYLRTGKSDEAFVAAKRAFALDGGAPLSHYALGMARLAARRFDQETLQHLEAAREQFPYVDKPASALRTALANSLLQR